MYYQNLMNMKQNNSIRNSDIKELDEWLIRIPYRNRNNLNFLQFSLDTDINEEIALRLFMGATKKESKVLEINYNVVTDDRMQSLGVFESARAIPEIIFDYDSGKEVTIKDSNIEVKFKIIAFPTQTLSVENKSKKIDLPIPTIESVKKIMSQVEMHEYFD